MVVAVVAEMVVEIMVEIDMTGDAQEATVQDVPIEEKSRTLDQDLVVQTDAEVEEALTDKAQSVMTDHDQEVRAEVNPSLQSDQITVNQMRMGVLENLPSNFSEQSLFHQS